MQPVPTLGHGRFLGRQLRRMRAGDLVLTESAYAPGARLRRHRHESAYYCIVLEGGFRETFGVRARDCDSLAVVYRPPGEEHGQQFRAAGGRCLNLELSSRWFDRHRDYTTRLDGAAEFRGSRLPEIALRLYGELCEPDEVSALSIEALCFEMLVESVRSASGAVERRPPAWLRQARELLLERFAEPLTLADIAAEVRIHPAHLARAFRRFHRCTVGEYVRRRRLEFVARALIETDSALASLACDAGFCDQSHLTRAFRSWTGTTPAAFRAQGRKRKSNPRALV